MTKKVYYIENTAELDLALVCLADLVPCFIDREYIEMDYSAVTIICRTEDLIAVERVLAPLV